MSVWIQVPLAAAMTVALFVGTGRLLARGLRSKPIQAQLAAIGLRLFLTTAAAAALAASSLEHRLALVFTVGATYFAATVGEGVSNFVDKERRRALRCSPNPREAEANR